MTNPTLEAMARAVLETHCGHPVWCFKHDDAIVGAIGEALHTAYFQGRRDALEEAARVAGEFEVWPDDSPIGVVSSIATAIRNIKVEAE